MRPILILPEWDNVENYDLETLQLSATPQIAILVLHTESHEHIQPSISEAEIRSLIHRFQISRLPCVVDFVSPSHVGEILYYPTYKQGSSPQHDGIEGVFQAALTSYETFNLIESAKL